MVVQGQRLVKEAVEKSGRDNTTALVIDIGQPRDF
jgi:hypothetical protein